MERDGEWSGVCSISNDGVMIDYFEMRDMKNYLQEGSPPPLYEGDFSNELQMGPTPPK